MVVLHAIYIGLKLGMLQPAGRSNLTPNGSISRTINWLITKTQIEDISLLRVRGTGHAYACMWCGDDFAAMFLSSSSTKQYRHYVQSISSAFFQVTASALPLYKKKESYNYVQ